MWLGDEYLNAHFAPPPVLFFKIYKQHLKCEVSGHEAPLDKRLCAQMLTEVQLSVLECEGCFPTTRLKRICTSVPTRAGRLLVYRPAFVINFRIKSPFCGFGELGRDV